MDWGHLFTSFDGRINRQPYWIGALVLVGGIIVLSLILSFVIGSSASAQAWSQIILTVLIAYPATAMMVKRLHDRNKPGIFAAIFWAPSILMVLGQLLGLTATPQTIDGQVLMVPTMLGWILIAIAFVIGIWALIELGFLRGTDGSNEFGPDPLQ
jgi:uncharacterized membrane protein YhaH (DUF805 family)